MLTIDEALKLMVFAVVAFIFSYVLFSAFGLMEHEVVQKWFHMGIVVNCVVMVIIFLVSLFEGGIE